MAAAQGLELHRPLRSSLALEQVFDGIRARVAFVERDRLLAPDLRAMQDWALGADWPVELARMLPSAAAAA